MAGEKLIKIIRQACKEVLDSSKPTEVLYAYVSSETPLKLKIEGKYEIDSSFLELSPLCKEKIANINGSDVVIWDGLKINDKVSVIRYRNGQSFYVLGKESV